MSKDQDKKENIAEWSKLYGRQITEEEYREICDNLYNFFTLLHEADKKDKKRQKDALLQKDSIIDYSVYLQTFLDTSALFKFAT